MIKKPAKPKRTRRGYPSADMTPAIDQIGGRSAMIEVMNHEMTLILEDGQIKGRLIHEPLTEAPERVHGKGIGSNCQKLGFKLSKHFGSFDPGQQ